MLIEPRGNFFGSLREPSGTFGKLWSNPRRDLVGHQVKCKWPNYLKDKPENEKEKNKKTLLCLFDGHNPLALCDATQKKKKNY